MEKKKLIGVVGVDSGQVMICDPSYRNEHIEIAAKAPQGYPPFDLGEDSESVQLYFRAGHAGAGVVSRSGYGDGIYPVYATINDDGRVEKLEIYFMEHM